MKITLYVRPGCKVCQSVINQVESLTRDSEQIQLTIEDLSQKKFPKVQIVPALFVEDELYSYVALNETRLKKMINSYPAKNY